MSRKIIAPIEKAIEQIKEESVAKIHETLLSVDWATPDISF